MLSLPRARVRSLVRELRSHELRGAAEKKNSRLLESLSYSHLPTQPSLAAILFPQSSTPPSQEECGSPNATGLSSASFGAWPLQVCSVAFSGLIPYLGIRELLGILMDRMAQEQYKAR